MAEPEVLSEADRRKLDSGPDDGFYESPRYVTHADDGFIDRLTSCTRRRSPPAGGYSTR